MRIRIKENEEQDLKNLLKMDYSLFVKELGDNIKDPKFIDAIKSLSTQHPLNFRTADPTVGKLLPTQNEIDVDKSLKANEVIKVSNKFFKIEEILQHFG